MSEGPAGRTLVSSEVTSLLASVSEAQMRHAASLFVDTGRRWFVSGQGRSGLVARMAAMRLMHLGFDVHAVGEATVPSIGSGDGLVMISRSGETPVTIHFSKLARKAGSNILAVTGSADSTLAKLADSIIEVPASNSRQFGGSLFEQCALLTLDALVFDMASKTPNAYECMSRRHGNLQ